MTMKKCSICKQTLPVSAFNKSAPKADGVNHACRECMKIYLKEHYRLNKPVYMKRARENKRKTRRLFAELKAKISCSNCGFAHPAAIDFHHPNGDKEKTVCHLVASNARRRAYEEIAKCIPLCANCHRILHYNERNGAP